MNGWKNSATWNVALWIGNDEELYREALEHGGPDSYRHTEQILGTLFPSGKTPDGHSIDDADTPEVMAFLQELGE